MVEIARILRTTKLFFFAVLLHLCFFTTLITELDAQSSSRSGSSRGSKKGAAAARSKKARGAGNRSSNTSKTSGASYMTGLYICLIALVLCFIPAILVFGYNLYKDPMTPQLLQRLFASLQQNLTGQLSKKTTSQNQYNNSSDNDTNNSSRNSSNQPESFFQPSKAKRQ